MQKANPVGITAGNDINVVGSSVAADTQLQLRAGNDVNIVAGVETATDERVRKSSSSGFLSKSSSDANGWQSSSTAVGSGINGENVSIQAGRDIAVMGSEVNAMEQTVLSAGRDVIITSSENTESGASYEASKSSGFAFGKEGLGYSKGSQSTNGSHTTTTQSGSSVTGGEVTLNAGRDVTVQASTVVADEDLDIYAARNVNIVAGTNTFDSEQASKSKSTTLGGFIPTGLTGVTLFSNNKSTQDGTSSGTSAVASTLGSLGGNVNILAGERYTQTGSDVMAPQGDINIYAKTVEITEARETITESSRQSSSSTTLGARPSNAVVDLVLAVKDVVDTAKATADTGNSRVQAMGAAVTAYKLYQTAAAVEAAVELAQNPSKAASISIEFQLGTSKSKSSSTQTSDVGRGSSVAAGGDVTIVASGAGSDSDIHVRGSEIGAGRNVNLKAEGDVLLESSQDKGMLESSNKSSGGSLGIGFSIGANTGVTFSASVNGARGNADGNDVIQQNTHVVAGNTVTIQSGADTTLAGATVTAPTVKADVGGDLTIESRQDVSTFESEQKSFGVGVTLCIPPICYGASSVSVSGGKQNIDSNYQNVTEQSGIRAGDGGFQVNVAQDTTLVGGAITSSDQAVNEGKNSFNTGGTLSMSDIQNQAEYEGEGFAFNATMGFSAGDQSTAKTDKEKKSAEQKPVNTGSAGYGEDSGSASSVTTSGISGIAGNDAMRTGDAETGITPIFDKEKVQRELDAQVKITEEFGKNASKAWGELANKNFASALEATDEEGMKCWGPNGACRAAGHALIGGVGGGVGGAVGATLSSVLAPQVQFFLLQGDLNLDAAKALTLLTVIGSGSIAGGASGAAGATNEVANNALLAVPYIVEVIIAGGPIAAGLCLNSPACVKTLQLAETELVAKVSSLLTADELANIPGFGAGGKSEISGSTITPIPDPNEAMRRYGPPPLENPAELQSWLKSSLEGYPAEQAEAWARDLIHTLPMADQHLYSDLIVTAVHSVMLGSQGVKTTSKTIWNGQWKGHLDVENPNPGQRAGKIHYQDKKSGKWLYDPLTDSFPGAPKYVNELLNNTDFRNAINKGLFSYLGEKNDKNK